MHNVKIRRRFGQNFLDSEMSQKIAYDLPSSPQDEILEIGPGHGALTEWLLSKCLNLTAVEIDDFCIPELREKFKNNQKFNLVHKNFLQFDIESWLNEHSLPWIAGNLPYNMATAIISHILPHIAKTKGCMFMTQLEVAERIIAKNCGSFSVFCACYAKSRIIRNIGPEHFRPRPKVNSATVFLEPLEKPLCTEENFFAFVRAAFSQKRKTIANSLSGASACNYGKERVLSILKKMNLSENTRAEELSPETLISFYYFTQV